MTETISVVFATRNRTDNLRRVVLSIRETAVTSPEIIIYIDNDDPESVEVAKELGIRHIQGPRKFLSQCYNDAAAAASGSLIMFGSDDIVFHTKGWDAKFIAEFDRRPDKIAYVHAAFTSDSQQDGCHACVHRNWIKTLGYWLPPQFDVVYFDSWLLEIACGIFRSVFLPDVFIEHMFPPQDVTKSQKVAREEHDRTVWKSEASRSSLQAEMEKLRKVMIG